MTKQGRSSEGMGRSSRGIEEIYKALVEEDVSPFRIKHPFRGLIQPYDPLDDYPLCRIGNFARITERYLENWINLDKLIGKMVRSRSGSVLNPMEAQEQRQLLREALFQIGTDSYLTEEEWKDKRSCRQIDSVIEAGTEITVLANKLMACSLESRLKDFFTQPNHTPRDRFVICDIGPGTGNTIIPLIELIDQLAYQIPAARNYADKLEIILIDGQQEALDQTSERLKKKSGHPDNFRDAVRNITAIRDNFGYLHRNPELAGHLGEVDLIISGAAIMHNTQKRPFFSMMHSLLKEEGLFCCWDWYFKTFIAPSIKIGERTSRLIQLEDKYSGIGTEYVLAEDEPLTPDIRKQREHSYCRVIGILPERELNLALQNNINWLWLYGYIRRNPHSSSREEKEIFYEGRFEPVSRRLTKMFWEKVRTPKGFNFVEHFLSKLVGIAPFTMTAYNYIEGYGDDYSSLLRKEGFNDSVNLSFTRMLRSFPELEKSTLLDEMKKETIRFSYGIKERGALLKGYLP